MNYFSIKNIIILIVIAIGVWLFNQANHSHDQSNKQHKQQMSDAWQQAKGKFTSPNSTSNSNKTMDITQAQEGKISHVWVTGQGEVIKTLPDDDKGSRHQRFLLKLADQQTLLIAHNIDLAPRLPSLNKGDTVGFYGEYVYNNKGGLVHWTHQDPKDPQTGGWLEYRNQRYQ